MRKILNSDSVELSEPKIVLSSIKSFYWILYQKRNDETETDSYNYLSTLNLPRLTDDESRLCEGELRNVGKHYRQWEIITVQAMMVSPRILCLFL